MTIPPYHYQQVLAELLATLPPTMNEKTYKIFLKNVLELYDNQSNRQVSAPGKISFLILIHGALSAQELQRNQLCSQWWLVGWLRTAGS